MPEDPGYLGAEGDTADWTAPHPPITEVANGGGSVAVDEGGTIAALAAADGSVTLTAGDATDDNDGGSVDITAGASAGAGNGGQTTISGGQANGAGAGGVLYFQGGVASGAGVNGGDVTILGGGQQALADGGAGGSVSIEGGFSFSGDPGNVLLPSLPTADPVVAGALWCDTTAGRVLKVSAGP